MNLNTSRMIENVKHDKWLKYKTHYSNKAEKKKKKTLFELTWKLFVIKFWLIFFFASTIHFIQLQNVCVQFTWNQSGTISLMLSLWYVTVKSTSVNRNTSTEESSLHKRYIESWARFKTGAFQLKSSPSFGREKKYEIENSKSINIIKWFSDVSITT